jgi:hypothetical protein
MELGALQESVHELYVHRNEALRMVFASRHAATFVAQREFWLEFAWVDQEYRLAVRRLAKFCSDHGEGWRRAPRDPAARA